ncbi:MAG: ParB/RepB/Spo0J family partition protein [Firmicutes bacterium]|nr:ParB/RepB/Spo0J family partition protein [Bacillota bacterium]
MTKRGLGKGLGALLPDLEGVDREGIQEIDVERIRTNPDQPRRHFDPEKLEELAQSVREHGIVQPLIVRVAGPWYELVAGERRWRAAKLAGLRAVPVVVRELSEVQVMEIALIENLQREDLNPIEEARAFRRLLEEFGVTQEDLARRLGKSRPQISNTLRLLNLRPEVQEQIVRGELSMGHAKVLLSLESEQVQSELARRVREKRLSVRETEEAAKSLVSGARAHVAGRGRATGPKNGTSLGVRAVEDQLREYLGTPVAIVGGGRRGRIEIGFFGEDDLGRIAELVLGEAGRRQG